MIKIANQIKIKGCIDQQILSPLKASQESRCFQRSKRFRTFLPAKQAFRGGAFFFKGCRLYTVYKACIFSSQYEREKEGERGDKRESQEKSKVQLEIINYRDRKKTRKRRRGGEGV